MLWQFLNLKGLLWPLQKVPAKREEWKSGFYHVAKKANVPICLAYLDYKNKIAGVGKVIFPTENMAEDMKSIMEYKGKAAKFPEFSTDLRYSNLFFMACSQIT